MFASRLVKGSGEILEEIVSKEQQRNINKVKNFQLYVSQKLDIGTSA